MKAKPNIDEIIIALIFIFCINPELSEIKNIGKNETTTNANSIIKKPDLNFFKLLITSNGNILLNENSFLSIELVKIFENIINKKEKIINDTILIIHNGEIEII